MTDTEDSPRNTANPSIFVIQTRSARGAASLDRRLVAFAGEETGSALLNIGQDEWLLARSTQKGIRTKQGSNLAVFTWLARQPGVAKVELLRGKVAMKRWYDNPPAKAGRMDSANPRKPLVDGKQAGWFSWNLKMVGAPEAWDILEWDRIGKPKWQNPSIKVGHLDTGMTEHPCLEFHDGSAGSTGHVLIKEGANVYDADDHGSLPLDPLLSTGTPGHGLRTLSVLCGFQPGLFAGVAPRANIIPFRVTNFVVVNPLINTNNGVAEGIRRATVDKGCRVLSMSLGDPCFPGSATGRAVDRAYEMGVIVVAAAGNVISEVTFPGRYARTIAVGGVSENRRPWAGGSYGSRVDLCAPADEVYRALRDIGGSGRAGYFSKDGDGTSYATTHVSGAAVMWLAHHGKAVDDLYGNTWRRVEAFRHCAQVSAKPGPDWDSSNYGAGILYIPDLLKTSLPDPNSLVKVEDLAADDQA